MNTHTLRVDPPILNILPHLLFFFLLNHFKVKGIRIFQYSPPAFFCVTSVSFIRLKKVNCDSRILSEVHIELSFY